VRYCCEGSARRTGNKNLVGANSLEQAALLAGSSVLVHDALGDGHVDALDGSGGEFFGVLGTSHTGGLGLTDTGVDFGRDTLVANSAYLVLLVALDCTLDVCH